MVVVVVVVVGSEAVVLVGSACFDLLLILVKLLTELYTVNRY